MENIDLKYILLAKKDKLTSNARPLNRLKILANFPIPQICEITQGVTPTTCKDFRPFRWYLAHLWAVRTVFKSPKCTQFLGPRPGGWEGPGQQWLKTPCSVCRLTFLSHWSQWKRNIQRGAEFLRDIYQQVAQLWQRDRASSIDNFKGWVNLRLNYRLKGYFSRHCDMTQFTLTYSVLNHVNVYVFDDTRTLCEKSLAAGARPKVSWRMRTTGRRMRSTWRCSCR